MANKKILGLFRLGLWKSRPGVARRARCLLFLHDSEVLHYITNNRIINDLGAAGVPAMTDESVDTLPGFEM